MRISLKSSALGLSAFAALAITAPSAWAGCGAEAAKSPAVFEKGKTDNSLLVRAANTFGQDHNAGIVGLWSVTFSGGVPPDWGYSEWHSDGTEIMNSGGHTAATGNFCLGVWAQIGPSTYKLSHFALGYDPSADPAHPQNGGALAAKISIQETVTLDPRGNEFSGSVIETIYDPNGVKIAGPLSGTIVGHRVTAY